LYGNLKERDCSPKPRWQDNIKMDLQEVGWGKDWIDVAEDSDRWRGL
jgi:hypothetical protein